MNIDSKGFIMTDSSLYRPLHPPMNAGDSASEILRRAGDQVRNAIKSGRQPGMPLSILSNIAREAPLGSLLCAFLSGGHRATTRDDAQARRGTVFKAQLETRSQVRESNAPSNVISQSVARLEFSVTHFIQRLQSPARINLIETRQAVLQFISDDRNNPLLDYAKKTSAANKDQVESAKPLYQLGQRMVVASTSKDKLTLKCSGALSVAVTDLKATKEVDFTVQQSPDGKISVSVDPFQF